MGMVVVRTVIEYNENGFLAHVENYCGAYTRGKTRAEALGKRKGKLRATLWATGEYLLAEPLEIKVGRRSLTYRFVTLILRSCSHREIAVESRGICEPKSRSSDQRGISSNCIFYPDGIQTVLRPPDVLIRCPGQQGNVQAQISHKLLPWRNWREGENLANSGKPQQRIGVDRVMTAFMPRPCTGWVFVFGDNRP